MQFENISAEVTVFRLFTYLHYALLVWAVGRCGSLINCFGLCDGLRDHFVAVIAVGVCSPIGIHRLISILAAGSELERWGTVALSDGMRVFSV